MREKKLTYGVGRAACLAAGAMIVLAFAGPLAALGGGERCRTEDKIYVVEDPVQKPVRMSGEAPAYPAEAKEERVEGTVVVRAVIDRDGKVASTEITESARQDLDAAAAKAIKTWTFEPATLEGEPVPVYYHLTVRFRLDGEKAAEDEVG